MGQPLFGSVRYGPKGDDCGRLLGTLVAWELDNHCAQSVSPVTHLKETIA